MKKTKGWKYICTDFNDRRKSAFSSFLWPTYYQFHLNLAVDHVSFYATPLSSEELACRPRAVRQIKRFPQDLGFCNLIDPFLSLYSAFPYEALLCFFPTLAASSLQLLFFNDILLFFLFPFLRSLHYTSLLPPLVTSFFLNSWWWGVTVIPCCM